jgi:hypothetical protein
VCQAYCEVPFRGSRTQKGWQFPRQGSRLLLLLRQQLPATFLQETSQIVFSRSIPRIWRDNGASLWDHSLRSTPRLFRCGLVVCSVPLREMLSNVASPMDRQLHSTRTAPPSINNNNLWDFSGVRRLIISAFANTATASHLRWLPCSLVCHRLLIALKRVLNFQQAMMTRHPYKLVCILVLAQFLELVEVHSIKWATPSFSNYF